MGDVILEMTDISKQFPGVLALDRACLDVRRGEVHIVAGENGAGKSTLMKVLAGAYHRDSGAIQIDGKPVGDLTPKGVQALGVSTIYQEFNLIPALSVAENVFLGREQMSARVPGAINWKRRAQEAQAILDSLQVRIDARALVKDLGIAQQQMVEVAKALSVHARIIVMDEPTASLTSKEIENLFRLIREVKQQGVSIIYISHRLEEFREIGDRITVMRDGKTIATLEIAATRIEELIRLMVGRELADYYPKVAVPAGKELLRVQGLARGKAIREVSFTLREGEILGLAGLMGAGRTEVARSIFALDRLDRGEIFVCGNKVRLRTPGDAIRAGIGFVTEDRKNQGLVLSSSVVQNVTLASLGAFGSGFHLRLGKERAAVGEYVRRLNIRIASLDQKAVDLSGGNQQKVVLAKWLLSRSRIFLFDEPTRGIDVGAKVEVYGLMNELVQGGAGILLISSEMPEIIGMSDRILVMRRGALAGELSRAEATQEKILSYATLGEA
ncbi:MAG TPA: sugar ABC transporter ATP-binding protein [Candidatus Methylomirabilis sp.]